MLRLPTPLPPSIPRSVLVMSSTFERYNDSKRLNTVYWGKELHSIWKSGITDWG